jgi:hypothetical protein
VLVVTDISIGRKPQKGRRQKQKKNKQGQEWKGSWGENTLKVMKDKRRK